MRVPVRKRGGQYCSVNLLSEKTLDQTANMRMAKKTDIIYVIKFSK